MATSEDSTPDDAELVEWDDVVGEDRTDPEYQSLRGAAQVEMEAEIERHRASLAAIRRARGLTQVQLAKALGASQGEVSRIEHQSDLFLSTLRSYVQAAGGELALVVRLPGEPEVEVDLSHLADSA